MRRLPECPAWLPPGRQATTHRGTTPWMSSKTPRPCPSQQPSQQPSAQQSHATTRQLPVCVCEREFFFFFDTRIHTHNTFYRARNDNKSLQQFFPLFSCCTCRHAAKGQQGRCCTCCCTCTCTCTCRGRRQAESQAQGRSCHHAGARCDSGWSVQHDPRSVGVRLHG